jgi:DNA-directed RNA polymerase subunit RPC12/RpoP
MLYKKPARVTKLAHAGGCGKPVDLRPIPRNEATCPACGSGGCRRHAGAPGDVRYRCEKCCRVFSPSPAKARAQNDDYARWLADMAS